MSYCRLPGNFKLYIFFTNLIFGFFLEMSKPTKLIFLSSLDLAKLLTWPLMKYSHTQWGPFHPKLASLKNNKFFLLVITIFSQFTNPRSRQPQSPCRHLLLSHTANLSHPANQTVLLPMDLTLMLTHSNRTLWRFTLKITLHF
jgi:hypothetical protein